MKNMEEVVELSSSKEVSVKSKAFTVDLCEIDESCFYVREICVMDERPSPHCDLLVWSCCEEKSEAVII